MSSPQPNSTSFDFVTESYLADSSADELQSGLKKLQSATGLGDDRQAKLAVRNGIQKIYEELDRRKANPGVPRPVPATRPPAAKPAAKPVPKPAPKPAAAPAPKPAAQPVSAPPAARVQPAMPVPSATAVVTPVAAAPRAAAAVPPDSEEEWEEEDDDSYDSLSGPDDDPDSISN
jgi:hypothetical protein